mmetsp:Transcript_13492/g.20536  ORF Transcript_13492/g.20536 Transcript_13492/m.20536 type:complete len:452 (-) Transcript_13492:1944-3299(-)
MAHMEISSKRPQLPLVYADDILSQSYVSVRQIEVEQRRDGDSLLAMNKCEAETNTIATVEVASSINLGENEGLERLEKLADDSVLSECSDDTSFISDEEEKWEDEFDGETNESASDRKNLLLNRLLESFRPRKRKLKRLRKNFGKGGPISKFLVRNEEMTQRYCMHTMNLLDDCSYSKETLLEWIYRSIIFEQLFCLPGLFVIVIYCMAHLCLYETFSLCYNYIEHEIDDEFFYVHIAYWSIILGFCLLRLSGNVWNYLDDDKYEGARFIFHNKLLLGDFDARLQKWFKRHPTLQTFLSICSYFFVYCGLSVFMHHDVMPAICDIENNLFINLPSVIENRASEVKALLMMRDIDVQDEVFPNESPAGFPAILYRDRSPCYDMDMCCWYEIEDEMESQDWEFLKYSLSSASFYEFAGYEHAPLYTVTCNAAVHSIAGTLCFMSLIFLRVELW